MIALILVVALAAVSRQEIDRTTAFSQAYHACETRSDANVDLSYCLGDELERHQLEMRDALKILKRDASQAALVSLDKSQKLWKMSVDFDCKAELNLGGSAAAMRATSCEIGLTKQRTAYLRVLGVW